MLSLTKSTLSLCDSSLTQLPRSLSVAGMYTQLSLYLNSLSWFSLILPMHVPKEPDGSVCHEQLAVFGHFEFAPMASAHVQTLSFLSLSLSHLTPTESERDVQGLKSSLSPSSLIFPLLTYSYPHTSHCYPFIVVLTSLSSYFLPLSFFLSLAISLAACFALLINLLVC